MSYNVNGLVHNCEIVTYLSENPSKIGITLYLYVKNEQGFIVLAYIYVTIQRGDESKFSVIAVILIQQQETQQIIKAIP